MLLRRYLVVGISGGYLRFIFSCRCLALSPCFCLACRAFADEGRRTPKRSTSLVSLSMMSRTSSDVNFGAAGGAAAATAAAASGAAAFLRDFPGQGAKGGDAGSSGDAKKRKVVAAAGAAIVVVMVSTMVLVFRRRRG